MNSEEFKEFAKAAIDYIADYQDTIENRQVLPSVSPGYLAGLIPEAPPLTGEPWQNILQDMDKIIMPGLTHWMSPNFHAYFPLGYSYPCLVGEFLAAGLGCVGLTWISCPVINELEVLTMNWMGKLLDLPDEFLNCGEGPGGGILMSSASESAFLSVVVARERAVNRLKKENPTMDEGTIRQKLILYTSDQSNSSIEKASILASLILRSVPTDEKGQLRGETLAKSIKEDKDKGFFPCCCIATLGTTVLCSFDKLEEIGAVCKMEKVWLHVDAAYAGTVFACPEYRHLKNGIEFSDSFNFNPHKWMLTTFQCSGFWVKDINELENYLNVERHYLEDKANSGVMPEYRHWHVALGLKFRSLKLWFVLRSYGVEGIRQYIRKQLHLAKYFENLVKSDDRFEVSFINMGIINFNIKNSDELTVKTFEEVQKRKQLYLMLTNFRGKTFIRFSIASNYTETRHLDFAWQEIVTVLNTIQNS